MDFGKIFLTVVRKMDWIGLQGGLSTVRQIRKQLHSFRKKKKASPTKAMPSEIGRRNHVQNILKI